MLSFLIIFGIAETNICFYNSDRAHCPDEYTSYSTDDFSKFKESTLNDDTFTFLITSDMPSNCVIDFSNIASSYISVTFKSDSTADIYHSLNLDFSQNKVFKQLTINYLDVNAASTTISSKFSSITLQRSRILNLPNLTVDSITADTHSLIYTNEITASQSTFEVISEGNLINESVRVNLKGNQDSTVQFKLLSSVTISLIDTAFYFGEQISFNFEKTAVKEISFVHDDTDKKTVNFQTVTYSAITNFPTLHFSLGSQNTIRFLSSNFPVITSPNNRLFATISGKSGVIEIENENAPFSIDCEDVKVILRTQKVTLNSISVHDSVNVLIDSVEKADLYLSSVVVASESQKQSTFTTQGEISVHIDQIQSVKNDTKCSFAGEKALYSVSLLPTAEIYSFDFSNFEIQKEAKYAINYILGQASHVSIDTVKGSDALQIVANFIGGSPTASQVDEHLNEELKLFELAKEGSVSISVTFPRYNTKGFNSATNIYTAKSSSTAASIVLDHHLDDFNNYLCIESTTEKCPEGSIVFADAKDFTANWTSHLRETAEDIYFYFKIQYTQVVDFTKFIQNDNHPHVYFESKVLILDQQFIQGELGVITVNGSTQGTQIVINRKVSPVMLISPLEFYNVMIAAHSIETINCSKLPYLKVDPIALSKYPQKCAPNYLILENFDSYSKFDFKESKVVLSSDEEGVNDVSLLIASDRHPYVNLTTKAKSVTFSASSDEEKKANDRKYLSVFSHFEMTSPGHVINSNLSADLFDGSIDVYNFNGLLNVVSKDGSVPLNFVDASSLAIQSETDVKAVDYVSINGNLDLSKSEVTTTLYDAHFGSSFQLKDNEKHGVRINKGFFDSRSKQEATEINGQLTLEGSLYVNSSTTLFTKSFNVDSDEQPTITIGYRLSEIPYIDLGTFTSEKVSPKIVFEYDESDRYGQFNEAKFSEYFTRTSYLDTTVPVVCGTGFDCSASAVEFKSSIPQFNGETSVVGTVCSDQCLSLKLLTTIPAPTPMPTPTAMPEPDDHKVTKKTIILVCVSSAAIMVFCIIIFISAYCKKKKEQLPPSLNDQKLLNSTN